MCYSKEVQIITGSAIVALSLYYYFLYWKRFQAAQKKWLMPFLKYVIIAFVLIGGHQIFEFLTLLTESQLIYKIGLILSISSMYFFLRSLEVILNRNLHSQITIWIIGLVALHAFSTEMTFELIQFYLRHHTAFIWSAAWMILFIYFHICAWRGRKLLKNEASKKAIIFYLLATLDVSFLLSLIYVLWGHWQYSVNVCTDSPSIWCTFYVVQVLALPIFLAAVPKLLKVPENKTRQTFKETFAYLVISITILLTLITFLPFFKCLSLKSVFP